jgi:pimeloyl-ACP methyl ester carboxylesterase
MTTPLPPDALDTTQGHLEVPGAVLEFTHHTISGGPARPTLVLLHEGLGSVAMWGQFPHDLARHTQHAVFVYSRKGYGASSPVHERRAVDFMHREAWVDLPAVLDAAQIAHFVLVGHSDGGSIATLYAGHEGLNRQGLCGVVLMAAHVFNEPRCIDGIRSAGDAYARTGLRSALSKFHGEQVDEVFSSWQDIWLDEAFVDWNIEHYLPAISVPVLTMQGTRDPYGSAGQIDAICAGVAGAVTKVLVAGCGHSLHRENPQVTLSEIANFLAQTRCGLNA